MYVYPYFEKVLEEICSEQPVQFFSLLSSGFFSLAFTKLYSIFYPSNNFLFLPHNPHVDSLETLFFNLQRIPGIIYPPDLLPWQYAVLANF